MRKYILHARFRSGSNVTVLSSSTQSCVLTSLSADVLTGRENVSGNPSSLTLCQANNFPILIKSKMPALLINKKTGVYPCYHFSLSASRGADLRGSWTQTAITGGTCRSLAAIPPDNAYTGDMGSVRCSEAIFHFSYFIPLSCVRISASSHDVCPTGMFSVKRG